jgi:hypothetical protein
MQVRQRWAVDFYSKLLIAMSKTFFIMDDADMWSAAGLDFTILLFFYII